MAPILSNPFLLEDSRFLSGCSSVNLATPFAISDIDPPLKANGAVVGAILELLHPVRRMPESRNELVRSEPCGRADDPIRAVSRAFAVDRGRTCMNDRAAKLVEIRGREDAVR